MNEWEKINLTMDQKLVVELLENILEKLRDINETLKSSRPSPS